MEYGETIRKLREKMGLSQNDLAKMLGVHKQMISDVERGKQKRLNPEVERKLGELFDLDLSLMHEKSDNSHWQAHEEVLLYHFRQIPIQKRLEVMACLLKCMAKHKN
ncbi:MAG: hypothetical protein C6H99_05420 [Epsilonproteobacteria bacterium]|nr:hypothetical protein [Campylobacterota bacterium]NPA64198.1 helix-turn-helix transcriptional regulator [Campylobacterota bacterium]